MSRFDPLAAFRVADPPYQQALTELRAAEHARDAALLEARRSGLGDHHLLAASGLELLELWTALGRANAAENDEEITAGMLLRAGGDSVMLTAVFEPAAGGWVQAGLLEWPGVITAGRTREDARALLRDAAREWLLSLAGKRRIPGGAQADYETLEVVLH
jgi:predicted RNase H-like HicB family nuclease